MKLISLVSVALTCTSTVLAGSVLWCGSFNYYTSVSQFDQWSWSTPVGEYQWYIHGSQPTSHYLALDPTYKNPADTPEARGLKLTVDSTSHWNSNFERSELIPQTNQNLGTGELFYHFSLAIDKNYPPDPTVEHQIVFFESHFTELKFGVSPNATQLEWMIQSVAKWSTPIVAGTWYNFAYDINFSAGTVGLWASTNGDPLVRVMPNLPASTSTNSEDWHLGVLSFGSLTEVWYFSGVYVENGPITTSISAGCGGTSSTTKSSSTSTSTTTSSSTSKSSSTSTSTSTSAGATVTKYGQCGGTGYTGPTNCASGSTCKAVSPPYYYQV
ncbi:carbohydrate-binding module family 1 protein [Sistotremastrum niveocremeum HHB9708]|uniref:Carbohydrate-binding module family 1 protein n=1 Tax=Sistotremastrum niveocremeum HHB9708 TaxID=1314777 RepID=A0A164MPW9_9AGAM|nr:carbohydrate-binding module family 1 protein [Sistotremastrum niveocremeum HHB9708]